MWGEFVDITADEVMAPGDRTHGRDRALPAAVDWLRSELAAGSRTAAEMEKAATVAQISQSTLNRARRELGVAAHRVGRHGPDGHCPREPKRII